MRKWSLKIIYRYGQIDNSITLKDLQSTVKTLKNKGGIFTTNKWTSPIIPLLIEHVFIKAGEDIGNVDLIELGLFNNTL